jgi:hypothetical protein
MRANFCIAASSKLRRLNTGLWKYLMRKLGGVKMNLPGFTAENSLHSTNGHYCAMAGVSNSLPDGRGVLPQLPRQVGLLNCLGQCGFNADRRDYSTCADLCFWKDFVGQGGSRGGRGGQDGLSCRPGCGACFPDGDSRTGRSKSCISFRCTHYDSPC